MNFYGVLDEQITGLSTPKGLTVPSGTRRIVLQAEGNDIRYIRSGRTAPTASTGMLLKDGDTVTLQGISNFDALRFIEVAPTAKLNVTYDT